MKEDDLATYSPLATISCPSLQVTAGVQMELGSTTQFAFQDQESVLA
jgi:hypothetical protein